MRRHSPLFSFALAALMLVGATGNAFAQKKGKAAAGKDTGAPPAAGGDAAEAPKVKIERGAGGKKIYRITQEITIEGKIQKPEAFYVLQKSAINYDWQELKQDFLPKIIDSVSKAPF